jgi:4-hydroxy-2-oxoglutarate aldolase
MTSEALKHHYSTVAEASAVPILLYSVPVFTGFDLPLDAAVQLASHPNIVGMKDSGRDIIRIGSIIDQSPEDFSMMVGSAALFLAGLVVGCVGTVSALANIAAVEMDSIQSDFDEGNLDNARVTQGRLIEPNHTLTAEYGVPGLKYALDLIGYKGGFARSPLLPLKEGEKDGIRGILVKAGLLD